MLVTRACAGGNARQMPRGTERIVEACTDLSASVGERWQMSTAVRDAGGAVLGAGAVVRPGATLTYELRADAIGGWPVEDTTMAFDLTGVTDGASITGPVQLLVGGVPHMTVPAVVNDTVTVPAMTLPAEGGISLRVPVTATSDLDDHDLRTSGTGSATPPGIAGGLPAEGCGTTGSPCTTLVHVRAVTAAPVAPTVVQPACEADRTVSAPSVTPPADTAHISYALSGDVEPGETVTVTATAAAGVNLVPATGWTVASDGRTATFTVTLADPDCREPVAPVALTVVQPVCEADGRASDPQLTLPADTAQLSYAVSGEVQPGATVTVTATAAAGVKIAPATGWTVAVDGRTATFTVTFADPDCRHSWRRGDAAGVSRER